MTTFEVKSVGSEPKQWSGQYGPMVSYKLDLESGEGLERRIDTGVELNRKPESRAPTVGEKLVGHLEAGKYAQRLKIDFEATKELGGSSGAKHGGGSSKPWQPESQRDPERSARILRQHSQSAALEYAAQTLALKGLVPEEVPEEIGADPRTKVPDIFWSLVDQFDADVNKAGQAAAQAHGDASQSSSERASLPVSASRGSEQPPADEDEHRLDDALYNAGINDYDERRWLTKAWKGLPSDRQKKCLGGLIAGDIETPPKTLKGLQEIAGPMPESFRSPDNSVPF